MTIDVVAQLVVNYPGKTSTELAKIAKEKPSLMNQHLRNAAEKNRVNRILETGINPKVTALRHYPIENFPLSRTIDVRNQEPITFGLLLPWKLKDLVREHTDYVDIIVAVLPQLGPDDLARILHAATVARLAPTKSPDRKPLP